ncbi:hypothetical protein ABKN59_007006 [Abortiporus biennis]
MDEFCIEHPSNEVNNRKARLVPLLSENPKYNEICELFNQGWKHPEKQLPRIRAIYKIIFPESVVSPFLKYQSSLSSAPSFWSPFVQRTCTEALLFHGTNRACLLGENTKNTMLCKLSGCSLCTIIRQSFDVSKCGNKHQFSRFGTGIYTSSCSSKADDYTRNLNGHAKLRVLLLNRVALGKTYKLRRNATDLKQPPSGYNSVSGIPGLDLNYEESVVYNNDAIRPGYLLVYGDADIKEDHHKLVLKELVKKIFTTPLAA